MEGDKISTLAELLRKSGEIILQGDETLLLNESLLKNINDSFTFLTEEDGDTHFQVTHSNNSDVELFRDVQFLHDFLQKVLKVCIVRDSTSHSHAPLKINKFRSLRELELKKVPVNNVYGIQRLRSQLNSVKCVYCLHQLKQLLIMCGADKSSAHVWEGLTEGVFTHNGIDSIDSSFEYTPWLQKIDLSYNNFKSFSVTFSLPNLKYLNLSYNLLESVPVVSREASNKLETLILKNNYIKDILALSNYENLIELDLSCNSLTEHSALVSLHNLSSLRTLSLIGNPLSFHKQHRFNTVFHLHSNTVNYKFNLDLKILSWRERRRIPKERVEDFHSISTIDGNSTRVQILPEGIGSSSASVEATKDVPSKHKVAVKSTRQKKQVKEAVIAEYSKEDEEEKTHVVPGASNDEHLKVKRRVQELREQFGQENWLVQRSATDLQAALSLPRHSPPSLAQLISQSAGQRSLASSPPEEPVVLDESSARGKAVDRLHDECPATDAPPLDGEASEDTHSVESQEPIEESPEEAGNSLEELQELEEGRVFAARLLVAGEETREVLVCAGDQSLQERDARSGGVRMRWVLPGPLRSCELLPASSASGLAASSPGKVPLPPSGDLLALRLSFDALRRDSRTRTYLMDAPDAQALVRFIDNILASRSLADMNQVPYKCMKCSTQFCREENFMYSTKGSTVLCPNCNSNIVCVMSESELPQPSIMEQPTVEKSVVTPIHKNSGSNKSSPQYSIGSGASLEGEGDCAAGVTVSSASLGSGTTSVTTTAAASDTSGRGRGDSDVEVLSSTSSIEVLVEGETRTTSRDSCNQDLEESRVQNNENKTAVPISLTESSSSGSLTESICTTYETSNSIGEGSGSEVIDGLSAQHNNDKNWPSQELLEKAMEEAPLYRFEPIPSIQEMFEGLLESVDKKLSTKADDITVDGEKDFIQYSYTDFSHADHRLHLYFLQELFQADDEKLLLVLRAEVLNKGLKKTFPSLLVVSSQYVWLLRVTGAERDTVTEWLHSQAQWPLHALCCAFALPWAQGVGIGLQDVQAISSTNTEKEMHHMLFFLQDPARTDAFLRAAEAALPKSCKILFEANENDYAQQLQKLELSSYTPSEDRSPIQFLGVFCSFSISDKKDYAVSYGVIAVRMKDILITNSNLMWHYPITSRDEDITVMTAQKICNLLEVETNKSAVSLYFVDETNQSQEIWHLTFETPVCVKSLVGAIQSPWEDIFSVSLQVRDVSRQ